ncbi:MAG: thiamine pyrophosphate-binding protein [Candidatus Riflebacteria bacterium]|nr:thiamine pyrophosphate-binding protein [Candidatus Riflebacteria bacterium]
MKASHLLMKFLEAEGVKFIFGVPGAPLMPIYHAMYEPDSRIKPIIAKHEEGAAFMADGFARVSGKIGTCCGTTGPGTTNLITGVAASYSDSIPILVLTAQVATTVFGKGAVQESTGEDRCFASAEIFKQITKNSLMVFSAENIAFVIRKALRTALSPRMGPVHLSLPPDIMRKEINTKDFYLEPYHVETSFFDREKIKEAAGLILRAKKPVLLIGFGVILSEAAREVMDLADLLTIPVATTPQGKGGFPEDHPLSLGVFGLAGTRAASAMILENPQTDLVLSVGMSFDEWGTNAWDPRLKGEKVLIQVDIDPNQIGKNYSVNLGLVGDAKTVLKELWFEIQRQIKESKYISFRSVEEIIEVKKKHPLINEIEKTESDEIPIKPQRLISDLRKALPRDTIFFIDAGNNMVWSIHYLQVFYPRSFNTTLRYSPMGYSIPAAIGGKLAAPGKPVVAICGDGGFMMHGLEVATAVNYDIPVIWVVLNDSRMNMIYQGEQLQNKKGLENYCFRPLNIAKIAEGMGALGIRVEKPDEIISAINTAISSNRPTVLDVIIDPDEISPIKERILAIQKFMKG